MDSTSNLIYQHAYMWLSDRLFIISFSMSIFIILFFITYKFVAAPNILNLPPGPKPLPIIGNLHQMFNERPVDLMQKWHHDHGALVTLRFGPQLAISVGSFDIAQELLAKRGAIYSSRPRYIIASERMTAGFNSTIMPYGKKWQNQHRIMNSMLDSGMVHRYHVLDDMESKQTLVELLATNNFEASLSRYASSILMTLGYGIRLEDTHSDIPAKISELNSRPFEAISNSFYQGVELFPILDKLPGFLAPWKQFAADVERQTTEFHMKHFEIAKSRSTWNWVQSALHSKAGSEVTSKELAYIVGTLQQGGIEAMLTVLRLLIKAIVLHPHCLEEAQRELDRVVGPDRLPSLDDLRQLSYIKAMMNEAMRWQPPAPLALPHATTQNDEYEGYHIPNGTIIIPNIWVMSFNPEIFPDPREFKPERWIQNPDLEHSPFGFGRRICPGRYMGWNSIFILMARLMWAYNITYAQKDGKRIDIDPWDLEIGFTATSRPFEASFKVRSPEKLSIIEREWENVCKDPARILEDIRPKRDIWG